MSDRDEEKQGIKVTDKRRFAIDDSGKVVDAETDRDEKGKPEPEPEPNQADGAPDAAADDPAESAPPSEHEADQAERPSLRDRVKAKLSGTAQNESAKKAADEAASGGAKLPAIDFSAFVLSLTSSVMIHFGDMEDPVSGQKSQNLPAAKQTIDILAMMQDKTKGNLSEPEDKLLEAFLYDLRMRYVSLTRK